MLSTFVMGSAACIVVDLAAMVLPLPCRGLEHHLRQVADVRQGLQAVFFFRWITVQSHISAQIAPQHAGR